MAGREVVENGLPSRDEITVYGLGATWTDQQWLAQVFMYGVYSLGGFALLSHRYGDLRRRARSRSPPPPRANSAPGARAIWLMFLPVLVAAPWAWTIRAQMLALPLYTGLLWLLASEARTPDADGSGSRSRCSSSGRTSTAASLLGALLVMLLAAYELDPQSRSDLAAQPRAPRPRAARRPRHAVRPGRDRALLPPAPRRPAVRGARHRVDVVSDPASTRRLLRPRGDRDRPRLAAVAGG